MNASLTPELVADVRCRIGENPFWNPFDSKLYWIDIPDGTVYRYDPTTEAVDTVLRVGVVTGGFTLQDDGAFLLFSQAGTVLRWKDGQMITVIPSLPGEAQHRFNDVITDPRGRVLAGTMSFGAPGHSGRLYQLGVDGSVRRLRDDLALSNGFGFSPDHKTLYHADSVSLTIRQFDYDVETGTVSNPRILARVDGSDGVPDGLTVDAEGFVWLAAWDGYRLIRYAPDGTVERTIPIPAKKVTSLTFGGRDGTELYVTTAGGGDTAENGALAGSVFRLRLGIRGVPEFLSRFPV